MKRVRVALIGAGTLAEWGILPVLSGPDIVAPPDTGAWWSRRADAASSPDIRYQAPAQAEIVAICDADRARAAQIATSFRIRAVYADWRILLREVEIDAIFCTENAEVAREIALVLPPNCRLWLDGLPTFSLESALQTENRLRAQSERIWCARTLRQSAAHRAARRLIERDQIGATSAISLRWNTTFAATTTEKNALSANENALNSNASNLRSVSAPPPKNAEIAPLSPQNSANAISSSNKRASAKNSSSSENLSRVVSSYAALDLLTTFAFTASHSASLNHVSSTRNAKNSALQSGSVWANSGASDDKTTSLMFRFDNGVTATALFCAADTWSAPLPRLEICGTNGRFLQCEAGRRLWLHQPREAARFWEPPGLSHHVSAANINGLAEDLKEFLAWCVAPNEQKTELLWRSGASLRQAMGALPLLDAASRSLLSGQVASWNSAFSSTRNAPDDAKNNVSASSSDAPNVQPTLSLSW